MSYIDATCEGICPHTDRIVFTAEIRIFYDLIEASGDDWNEPREDAHVEFTHADRTDVTPHQRIERGPLLAWAEEWLSIKEGDILEDAGPDPDEARERRFDREMEDRACTT